jgi:ubiquinone/menaquinone biosynthesis C-methylase UbiE
MINKFSELTKDMATIKVEDWDNGGLYEEWVKELTSMNVDIINEGLDEFFDIRLDSMPSKYFGNDWHCRIVPEINFFKINEGRVLDVGCGTGQCLSFLSENIEKFGLEFSDSGIRMCKEKYNLKNIFKCNVSEEKFPFEDKQFDHIIISHVLEHLKNPYNTMKEIKRVLKDDGIIHIAIPRFLDENMVIIKGDGMIQSFPFRQHHKYFYPHNFTYRGFIEFLNSDYLNLSISEVELSGLPHLNHHWIWFNVRKSD